MTADELLRHHELGRLARILHDRPGRSLDLLHDEPVLQAAVAIVLRPGGGGELELLLIKRAEFEGDPWSGHVAFPGGRREPGDHSLADTAVRETWEETAIHIGRTGQLLGALDEISPTNPMAHRVVVRPYVAAVTPDVTIVESPEVAAAFWVPLGALRTETSWIHADVRAHGLDLRVPAFAHGDYVVWGLTERILRAFLALRDEPER